MIDIKNKLFHPYDRRPFIKRLLGYCDCPCHKRHWFIYPSTIRKDTMYEDEELNYVTCCEEFYDEEIKLQIQKLWDDYILKEKTCTNL